MATRRWENSLPGSSAGTWFSNTPWARSLFLLVGRGMWCRFCETSAFISLRNYRLRGGRSLLWRMERRAQPFSICRRFLLIVLFTFVLGVGVLRGANV